MAKKSGPGRFQGKRKGGTPPADRRRISLPPVASWRAFGIETPTPLFFLTRRILFPLIPIDVACVYDSPRSLPVFSPAISLARVFLSTRVKGWKDNPRV